MEDLGHRQLLRKGCSLQDEGVETPIRILQVTDLHHFPSWCTEFDVRAAKGRVVPIGPGSAYSQRGDVALLASILERVRPHLVVLTGDIIDGRPFGVEGVQPDVDGWRTMLLEVLAPIVAAGCAWTFVPGNHDDDGSPWSREALLGAYRLGKAAPGCVSEGAGTFNHFLTVGATAKFSAESSVRLWFFDSGGNHEDPKLKYHTFGKEAVDGYVQLSSGQLRSACELAYFHIPLPQSGGLVPVVGHNGLFDAALHSGQVPAPWKWQPFTSIVRLLGKDRIVGSSKLESGMFKALVSHRRVRACFFGHDHASDAVFLKDGLYMAYGRVGGTTPPVDWEGDAGPQPFEAGARVVEWDPRGSGQLRTWVEIALSSEKGSELLMDGAAPRKAKFCSEALWILLPVIAMAFALSDRRMFLPDMTSQTREIF